MEFFNDFTFLLLGLLPIYAMLRAAYHIYQNRGFNMDLVAYLAFALLWTVLFVIRINDKPNYVESLDPYYLHGIHLVAVIALYWQAYTQQRTNNKDWSFWTHIVIATVVLVVNLWVIALYY